MDIETRRALAGALLKCPCMADKDRRNAVVRELPEAIQNSVQRSEIALPDVLSLIGAALNHERGLDVLIDTVRFFEGDSLSMRAVERTLASYVSESASATLPVAPIAATDVSPGQVPSPERAASGPDADLIRGVANGEVCAFIGAGLSLGAGLPGWYDLLAELSASIGHRLPPREWATGDILIDAAQAYINRQGLHSLISHLKDRLDTTGKQPTAAHRALARLPLSLVFTANFDNFLERAFQEAGKRVDIVVRDSAIPFMRRGPNTVNLVKLYGDLSQPDTIVLARQQYESYFLQRQQVVKLLETELARSYTLYLGWSGSDPHFKLVFGELLARFGDIQRPGYAVMFDLGDDQRVELARRHIRPVELPAGDRTARLAEWLASLSTL